VTQHRRHEQVYDLAVDGRAVATRSMYTRSTDGSTDGTTTVRQRFRPVTTLYDVVKSRSECHSGEVRCKTWSSILTPWTSSPRPSRRTFATAWVPDALAGVDFRALLGHPNAAADRSAMVEGPTCWTWANACFQSLASTTHFALHRACDPLRDRVDERLRPEVCGYRTGAAEVPRLPNARRALS